MPKRSLFNQFTQNRGTINFEDLRSYRELAETSGRTYITGTLTVVSGSATVTDLLIHLVRRSKITSLLLMKVLQQESIR